jgi:hypothetical protein
MPELKQLDSVMIKKLSNAEKGKLLKRQEDFGGWTSLMDRCLGLLGTITRVAYKGTQDERYEVTCRISDETSYAFLWPREALEHVTLKPRSLSPGEKLEDASAEVLHKGVPADCMDKAEAEFGPRKAAIMKEACDQVFDKVEPKDQSPKEIGGGYGEIVYGRVESFVRNADRTSTVGFFVFYKATSFKFQIRDTMQYSGYENELIKSMMRVEGALTKSANGGIIVVLDKEGYLSKVVNEL